MVTDAVVLAAQADSVLLVAMASGTTRHALCRTCDLLVRANAKVAGVVVNGVDQRYENHYYCAYGRGGVNDENGYGPDYIGIVWPACAMRQPSHADCFSLVGLVTEWYSHRASGPSRGKCRATGRNKIRDAGQRTGKVAIAGASGSAAIGFRRPVGDHDFRHAGAVGQISGRQSGRDFAAAGWSGPGARTDGGADGGSGGTISARPRHSEESACHGAGVGVRDAGRERDGRG